MKTVAVWSLTALMALAHMVMAMPASNLQTPPMFSARMGLDRDFPKAATALRGYSRKAGPLPFTGVNIAGGEFDRPKPGNTTHYGSDYIYPSPSEVDYFAGEGVNIIRFPFRWEDAQPRLMQPLDPDALSRIKAVVAEATHKGIVVILDPHNYARYYEKVIGGPEVSDEAFADFWSRLAAPFRDNPRVWFGLMNEPYGIPPRQWLSAANAAIAAIRRANANNLLLVPGIAYTGAHSWIASGNGEAMLRIKDPRKHYIFDVHQYLDVDSSGTKPDVVSEVIGSQRLEQFTHWCRQHHQRGFLGEFAAGNHAMGARATEDMLSYMERNRTSGLDIHGGPLVPGGATTCSTWSRRTVSIHRY